MANIIEELKNKFSGAVLEQDAAGAIFVPADKIKDIFSFLKLSYGPQFDYLSSLTAVDHLPDIIEVVYHLYSVKGNTTVVIKTKLNREAPAVASITEIYKGADWFEREVYDLFGVDFTGHPDLRRILTPEDCEGYPLRKDYSHPRIMIKPKAEVKNI